MFSDYKDWIEAGEKENIKFIDGQPKEIVSTYEESREIMKKLESNTLSDVYFDRNQAILLTLYFGSLLGFKVGIKKGVGDWIILYLDLPTGQVSWHLPRSEIIGEWAEYIKDWDGHTLEEKRQRIKKFLTAVER